MLHKKPPTFSTKFKLFVLTGCSVLFFLAGSLFLLVCFAVDVTFSFGKEKLNQKFDQLFEG